MARGAREPAARGGFAVFTSFPLVHGPVQGDRPGPGGGGTVAASAPRTAGGDGYVRAQVPQCHERRATEALRFRRKRPIPCLLPTNSFIAQTRRRDEEHYARSQVSFARATARGTREGMRALRLRMQPHVTLHYDESSAPLWVEEGGEAQQKGEGQHVAFLRGAVPEEYVKHLKSQHAGVQQKMNYFVVKLQSRARGIQARAKFAEKRKMQEEVGIAIEASLQDLEDAVLDAFWDSCHRLKETHPEIEAVPSRGNIPRLVRWILDLPSQNESLLRRLTALERECAADVPHVPFVWERKGVSQQMVNVVDDQPPRMLDPTHVVSGALAPHDGTQKSASEDAGNRTQTVARGIGSELLADQQARADDFAGNDGFQQLLGSWKWKTCGGNHWPRWILPDSSKPAWREAASVWRAPTVSLHMPSGGRNLWRSERVSPCLQALFLKPRPTTKDVLLHRSSAQAPPYAGDGQYLWTPDSLRPNFGDDELDCLHLWS